ncbi:hypothetical protein QYF36_000178 [Acer negundo]|nr:hypothetical protein QYF36_000178 [Acer negundo]
MTINEFKRWLKKLDADKDGRISREELADAVRGTGGWFARFKAKRGVRSVDSNGNGFIDESEFKNLVEFAEKHLDGKREMTINEFKRWLKKFDADKDGKISRKELAEAVHVSGGWFAKLKAKREIRKVDSNGNGYVDESEFKNLVKFAEKQLGVRILHF